MCISGWVGVGVGANFVAMKSDLNERKRWEQVDATFVSRWQEQMICLCVCGWGEMGGGYVWGGGWV